MKQIVLPLIISLLGFSALAQEKKPLTHEVYDGWKSARERAISNDGNYIMYAINPQEGDGELIIQNVKTGYKKSIARGYSGIITQDNRFAIFKIKPFFNDIRQTKIKNLPDRRQGKTIELPSDSLAILLLGTDSIIKVSRIKSYNTPQKGSGWIAYSLEKPLPDTGIKKKPVPDSITFRIEMLTKLADSLIRKSLDSVKGKIEKSEVISAANKAVKEIYKRADELQAQEMVSDTGEDEFSGDTSITEGTELIVKNLYTSSSRSFSLVSDYFFDKKGKRLLMKTTKSNKDTNSRALVLIYHLQRDKTDTVMTAFNDAVNFSFDDEGNQLAFVAERDSSSKALQKFYKLWYYKEGADSASILVDKNTRGMKIGSCVSENGSTRFSKDGLKLFFGTAPVRSPKDTTLVDFELARLDIWHYNDDYLQPQQLKELAQEMHRSYMAVIKPGQNEIVQLGDENAENISMVDEGNADWVLAKSTKGNRIARQWEGRTKTTAYIINTNTAERTLIKNDSYGNYFASPNGKYVYWYNPAVKKYFTYNVANGVVKNISENIKVPLYDTENDLPDFPSAAGTIGWVSGDRYFLIKDEFDIWQLSPNADELPRNLTNGYGRKNKISFSYVKLDAEKLFFESADNILLKALNKINKQGGYFIKRIDSVSDPKLIAMGPYENTQIVKAKDADGFLMQRQNPSASELYYSNDLFSLTQVTSIADQQKNYNWYTTELVRWKMLDGKMSEGILYKPENFDPKKKYPVIFYFYERDADELYNYLSPSPTASIINIPYFVSNGYLVFNPNIYYKSGKPGESAYNSVVSAAKYLSAMSWVDAHNMGIQGQSWGGYQVAYLITKTNMFRAAGAGAPVSNMTSAYGGIRWQTGVSRQFQYEKTQSRLGATLWERPDLYIKNSPLFLADKVNTPLLMMHNDEDGAVPWYQSIEFFTALKRLNKKVWLLQYNGEDHNLNERKNRKDLSIRLGQFFDYYLKGARPANWIKYGLPATEKGKDWGLDVD